jgi:SPP1 family predicted phage head-tail adaptor
MAGYNINAGELRTQITLQMPTIAKDAGAAQKPGWANATSNPTVWARWINAHGQDVINGNALKSVQRAVVTLRHRADIKTTWRVLKDDGTYWEIVSIDEIQDRNRWVDLVVERAEGSL